jgi:PPM family protein phosphatase
MAELRVGSATDTGRIRPENEDNFLVTATTFVVADGMGGHEAGEVASQIAVDGIRQRLDDIASTAPAGDDATSDSDELVATLPTALQFVESIAMANSDIFRAAIVNPAQRGMGTTVTAIAVIADPHGGRAAPNVGEAVDDDGDAPGDIDAPDPGDVTPVTPAVPSEALVLANVGDSRTYLFRHGRLRRVTIDHSYVQELVATGHITEDEARTHPRRNIITRALGIEPEVRVDWWTLPLIRGDRFVLCSDGLVDEVTDAVITGVLVTNSDPQEAAEGLIDAANAAGGRDNITVIVVDVLAGDEPPDPTLEIDVVPTWADDANRPTAAGTLALDADARSALTGQSEDPTGPLDRTALTPATKGRRSGLVKFVTAFAIAAAIVIAFVVFSVWASSGYFIAFNGDDQAIVYKGREGGVLWIDPTAQNEVGPTRDQLEPESVESIDDGMRFDSQEDAVDYLRDSATTTTTTTTTTTSTTTTTTSTTVPVTDVLGATPTETTASADASAPTGVTTIAAP